MNAGFIAALLVMVIMTAFVFIILHSLSVNTGDKIRDNIVNQIKVYDVLIQEKEAKLQELKNQIENINAKQGNEGINCNEGDNISSGVYVTPQYIYINQDFMKDYRHIKERLKFNRNEVVQTIHKEYNNPQYLENQGLIDDLIDKLSIENVYKISAFSKQEQLEIIDEILSAEEKNLLSTYLLQNKSFNCMKFYQWLYVQRQIKDNKLTVATAEKGELFDHLGMSVKTVYDGNLCEGIQIYVGNRLYDYGIRKRELLS